MHCCKRRRANWSSLRSISVGNGKSLGFPKKVIEVLDAITRRPDESYDDFIGRILKNHTACRVKLADLADNMDLTRISSPAVEDYQRVEKYKQAVNRIHNHMEVCNK